jgi:hypothetical protein
MSDSIHDYVGDQWPRLKRCLHRVCMAHAEALVLRLCAEECWRVEASRVVKEWIETRIGPDLNRRVIGAGAADGPGSSPWALCLSLFYDPAGLAAQLQRSASDLCRAWGLGDDERAKAIYWTAVSRYLYEARFLLDGPTGQHRLRNWNRIRKERAVILDEWRRASASASDRERPWLDRRLGDPAAMAAELVRRHRDPACRFSLDDVATTDGVLAYLFAYLPHLDIGDMEHELGVAAQLPDDLVELVSRCLDDAALLSAEEAAAIKLKYFEDPEPMNDEAFHERFGFTRQTFRNRVKRALKKLAGCLTACLEEEPE